MKKIAPLLVFALALLLLQNGWRLRIWLDPIDTSRLQSDNVIMYSTPWCPYCAKARRFFRVGDIPYTEYDVEASALHYEQYQQLGGNGVPLIKIGNSIIRGYNPGQIRSAIEQLATAQTGPP